MKQLTKPNISIKKALNIMETNDFDSLVIINNKKKLLGIFTFGDFQRLVMNGLDLTLPISEAMNKNFVFLEKKDLSKSSINEIFNKYNIDIIPVINNQILIKLIFRSDYNIKKRKETKLINQTAVVIMAGGLGSRLKPLSNILPKPLFPIGNKTILQIILEKFKSANFKNIHLSINYKSNLIKFYNQEYLNNFKINYIEEKKYLGTIGAVKLLKTDKKYIYISNCDVYANIDYIDLLKHHTQNKNDITILTSMKEYQVPYGVFNLNENGNVKSITEKPSNQYLVNTGIYIINSELIKIIPKNKEFTVNDLISKCIKSNKKIAVVPIFAAQWTDIGEWSQFEKKYININKN